MYIDENHYALCLKDGRNWGYYWYDENNKRHFKSTGRMTARKGAVQDALPQMQTIHTLDQVFLWQEWTYIL